MKQVQITIMSGKFKPDNNAQIYAMFENGFVCMGFYHADQNDIFCGEKTYLFEGVGKWFQIPDL